MREIKFEAQKDGIDDVGSIIHSFVEARGISKRLKIESFRSSLPLVRVFVGGHAANQCVPFVSALQSFMLKHNLDCQVEYLYVKDVREIGTFNESGLVNWMLNSDVHFILTHIHQGLQNILDCRILANELSRLANHIGFPCGHHLTCPIFTQDKGVYLEAVRSVTCPTLLFNLCDTSSPRESLRKLDTFLDENNEGTC